MLKKLELSNNTTPRQRYYAKNEERIKAYHALYRTAHKDDIRRHNTARRHNLKLEIFTHYGLKCQLCPESRLGALHIDHVGGGGNIHRSECGGDCVFYQWLKTNKSPDCYRTLCANCNFKAYLESRILAGTSAATRSRRHRAKLKQTAIELLGGVCRECGCSDIGVLTVQHINNDGAAHKRALGNRSTATLHRSILQGTPTAMECLCFSCNGSHYYEGLAKC